MSGKTNKFIEPDTEEMFSTDGIPEQEPEGNVSKKYTTDVNNCYTFLVTEVIIWRETP